MFPISAENEIKFVPYMAQQRHIDTWSYHSNHVIHLLSGEGDFES